MTVDPHTAKHRADYHGHTYYFCSPAAAPNSPPIRRNISAKREAANRSSKAPSTPARCIREIRQVGPGACPICGMALEPEIATADSGPNPELADMTRRFWIGLVLALPVMVLEMGGHFVGAAQLGRRRRCRTTFSSPSPRRWCCGRAGRSSCAAAQSLVTRNLNMFTLIAMGTGVAYVYSVVATFAPGIFPDAFRGTAARRRSISKPPA